MDFKLIFLDSFTENQIFIMQKGISSNFVSYKIKKSFLLYWNFATFIQLVFIKTQGVSFLYIQVVIVNFFHIRLFEVLNFNYFYIIILTQQFLYLLIVNLLFFLFFLSVLHLELILSQLPSKQIEILLFRIGQLNIIFRCFSAVVSNFNFWVILNIFMTKEQYSILFLFLFSILLIFFIINIILKDIHIIIYFEMVYFAFFISVFYKIFFQLKSI
ncbi:transmembrane protein, putative (macronuclear) [Tetrahymena thermophila SB210]|uniref:Transmembrane protein, putative n=1 Tax=Tetrahymena thermophila (strain SB210) TaxID=312017 RepID=W7X4Z2_TETTS|nr:transmembrane protein, putative [Tetrahymena thermophila SB210]EWS72482.1 transmembrane protein, putative [Tetrahymena thermophila SB210]|eukprot:XP_012654979.1 transmembrane protein, putative [Tetrahymena thermophila SB210]